MKKLERIFKSLANRRRLAILKFLQKNKEANVSQISGAINLSFKATSRHLGVLSAADVVEKEQRSLEVYYRLARKRSSLMKTLLAYIPNSRE